MICPHCEVATAYDPVKSRKSVELNQPGQWEEAFRASGSIYDEGSGYFFGTSRCQACDKAFPIRGRAFDRVNPDETALKSTLEPLWPTIYKIVPAEIPSPTREAMEDASAALGAGSVLGSMLAARTAMIRAQRQTKKELGLPEASLKALYEAGRVSKFEFESSDLARRWANYLGHEDPDHDRGFTKTDAEEFYGYAESLLDSLYVKWDRLSKQRGRLTGTDANGEAGDGQSGDPGA